MWTPRSRIPTSAGGSPPARSSTSRTALTYPDVGTYQNQAGVWVTDNEYEQTFRHGEATASTSVTVTDAPPTVSLTKTVDATSLPEPGGVFNFTLTVTNTSQEMVWIDDLTDSQYPDASGYNGQTLGPW